ncbi:MAG: hypothetical protein QXT13_11895 [Pyrobaculum sp.]
MEAFIKTICEYVKSRGEVDIREVHEVAKRLMPSWVPEATWVTVMRHYLIYYECGDKICVKARETCYESEKS